MNEKLKTTFEEFATNYRIKKDVRNIKGFEDIFNMMNSNKYIYLAICNSFCNMPALIGIAGLIGAYVDFTEDCEVDLYDSVTKQTIGIMQKAILEPFGLFPVSKARIPERYSGEFTQAAIYKYEPDKAKIKLSDLVAAIEKEDNNFLTLR